MSVRVRVSARLSTSIWLPAKLIRSITARPTTGCSAHSTRSASAAGPAATGSTSTPRPVSTWPWRTP